MTTTDDAIVLVELALALLREKPDHLISLCKASDIPHATARDIVAAAFGAVYLVDSGGDLTILDVEPAEGD